MRKHRNMSLPMDANDSNRRLGDRNADLIAAARRQFEQTPSAGVSHGAAIAGLTGVELQNYEVVREIHRGGQGVVYLAWQRGTRRNVAIKMVREGPFASASERARFQREIEILGTLEHPHIVSIHDSGIVAGSSYFVMDYVDGPALDEYIRPLRERSGISGNRADRRRFLRDALTLFAKVCDAVQAAHLRGVIHRDLKPTNVRVDPKGEPRVLDFGLAKTNAMAPGSSAAVGLTLSGQFLGTLAYASPEQAEGAGNALDVRTDVYSLGVMLYEMVTGRLPYDVEGKLPDVLNNIRHVEPVRPSMHTDLRGDLDTILLKCLNKPKDRRYQAAGELAEDLRRYIDGKPIEAKRDSAIYMLRMFARRHWPAALTALAFVILLGLSSIALGYMYSRQVQLRRLAEENAQKARDSEALAIRSESAAQRIAEFQASQLSGIDVELMGVGLREKLLDVARKTAPTGSDEGGAPQHQADVERVLAGVNFTNLALRTLEENIFDRTLDAIDAQFEEQPLVRAGLLQTIADTMRELGLLDRAMAPQAEALEIRRSELGGDHPQTLTSICNMGLLLESLGRLDEAAPYYHEALDKRRLVLGDEHEDTAASINNLGSLLYRYGQYSEALPIFEEAVDANRRILGDEHPNTLNSINNLAYLHQKMGKYDDAEELFGEALDTRRRVLGNDHPQTLNSINNMAFLRASMGQLDEARILYEEALEGRRRVLGDMHPNTLESFNGMGALLQRMARFEEAETHFLRALDGQRRILGSEHPETLISINNMGHLLHSMGRLEEALPYYEEALDTFRRKLGPEHPNTLTLIGNMGSLLKMMGRLDEAAPYQLEALDLTRRVHGDEHPSTLSSILRLGALLQEKGELEDALTHYREALVTSRRVLPEEHMITIASITYMGSLLDAMGQFEEAMSYCDEALTIRRRTLGDQHHHTLLSMHQKGNLLRKLEQLPEAEPYLLEAAAGAEKLPPELGLYEKVAGNLVALYEAWHAAEPDAGHDESAAEWRDKLANTQAQNSPSAQP